MIDPANNQPAKFLQTYLGVPSAITQFNTSMSNDSGIVKFEMNNFYGGQSVVAMTNPFIDSQYIMKIDDPFSKKFSVKRIPAFLKATNYPNTFLQQSISMQVQNIYAGNKMNEFYFPSFTDTSAFYVKPDFRYDLDNYTRFTSIEEVLREYVVLVNVRRKNKQVLLPIINVNENQYFPGQPINLLDGVPVFDFNKFFEFDPLKIKTLEVITQKYIYGNAIFDGILNWKTNKPTLANYNLSSNALVIDYEGMQLHREFYAPVYDNEAKIQSRIPDYRNVLQWIPDIQLKGNKAIPIKFYTSDLPGRYAVVAQGLSATGTSGSSIITFEVR